MSVKLFSELFTGRKNAYGFNQMCLKKELTQDIYAHHLTGERRIGVYPIINNKFTKWVAVDIDEANFNIARDYALVAEKNGVKAYIERSKSKGFHVWIFFKEQISSLDARLVVEMFLSEIEYNCEIFPKQDMTTEERPFGNFIFLPLFGGNTKEGKTVFVDINNEVLIQSSNELTKIELTPLSAFKDIIEANELKREKSTKTDSTQKTMSNSSLPCIKKIKEGIKRGHRNECAFRLAIHLKDKGLSHGEVSMLITNWNEKNEPAKDKSKNQTLKELQGVVDSVFKGQYKSYGCESGIILEYCDKEKCPIVLAQDKKAQIEKGLIVLMFRDAQTMVFRKKGYEYRLTNFDFSKSGKFKCSLTLSNLKEEKVIFKDFISLDIHTHRQRYVKASKDKEVDKDLMKIDGLVRKQIEKEEKEKIAKAKQLYVMTEKEKNEALQYLEDHPHILKDVITLTDQMGIIGEETIRLMVYLCFTSRIIKEPLSITIKGESSSGKSYIPTRVKRLIPEEGCFFITRATANAFYHLPEDGMQHKIIFIAELPGSESADYSIRTAQSEGDLILWMPIKDPHTGDQITQTKTVKGPVGFLMTTTKASLFNENETRNFSLFTDDSAALTKKISDVTIRKAKGETFELDKDKINLFKNMQRLLNPDYKVIMPFASDVFNSFPNKPVRIRRDKERFRVLIEIITILHQFHRKQIHQDNGVIHLEATLADYYLAKKIAENVLLETIYEIGPAAKEIWEHIIEMKETGYRQEQDGPPGETFDFTYKEIMEALDWKYDKVKKWTLVLLKAGIIEYAEGVAGGRGKATKYKIARQYENFGSELAGAFLPSVAELYEKYPCEKNIFYNPLPRPENSLKDEFVSIMEEKRNGITVSEKPEDIPDDI